MPAYSTIVLALSTLLAAIVPGRAFACTCSVDVFYDADPKNGASSVALDAAPYILGAFDASTIRLEDERGTNVDITVEQAPPVGCLGAWAELKPKAPLAPNTRYTLRADTLYPDSVPASQRTGTLSFTTGDKPLPEQHLEPPQIDHASVLLAATQCGGDTAVALCIGGLGAPMPKDLELIARRDDQILLRITGSIYEDETYGLEDVPTCIELRRRAGNGQRSEPVTICGDALGARDPRSSDYERTALVCHDGLFGERSANTPDAGPPDAEDAGAVDAGGASAPHDAGAPPPTAAEPPPKVRGSVSACSVGAGGASAADLVVLVVVLGGLLRRRRAPRLTT